MSANLFLDIVRFLFELDDFRSGCFGFSPVACEHMLEKSDQLLCALVDGLHLILNGADRGSSEDLAYVITHTSSEL